MDNMLLAIDAARAGMRAGRGGPFGACIVQGGRVVAVAANSVLASHDPTAHAEICAIRTACSELGTHVLGGAEIYSSTEPCPMCFAAVHWARIARVYYGTAIADVQSLGFNELTISNEQMRTLGGSRVEIVPGVLRDQCMALLEEWLGLPNRQIY